MSLDERLTHWWAKALAYALLAAFGGAMGHLMRTLDHGGKPRWSRTLMEAASAGFVGLLVFMACQELKLAENWTGVVVGVSGWLGSHATIHILEGVVRKKLGLKEETPDGDADGSA